MNLIKRLFALMVLASMFASCEPDEVEPCMPAELGSGLFILNEGLFQQNNSSIDFKENNSSTVNSQIFNQKNNRGIGDTGNDMLVYGSKIYCVVSVSGTVEVINKSTAGSIAQIPLHVSGVSKQPRSMVAFGSSVWVSNFDGTVVEIDTTSLTVVAEIEVGKNPEGVSVLNNKLYVANSGGLDSPNYDSTISVIDLNINAVIQTGVVRINPSKLVTGGGNLFCISNGNYTTVPSVLQKLDPTTMVVQNELEIYPMDINFFSGKLYVLYRETDNGSPRIGIMDPATMLFETPNLIENSEIVTFYGFDIDIDGNIYCRDANGYVNSGRIYTYSNSGQSLYDFQTGINPNSVVSVNN